MVLKSVNAFTFSSYHYQNDVYKRMAVRGRRSADIRVLCDKSYQSLSRLSVILMPLLLYS